MESQRLALVRKRLPKIHWELIQVMLHDHLMRRGETLENSKQQTSTANVWNPTTKQHPRTCIENSKARCACSLEPKEKLRAAAGLLIITISNWDETPEFLNHHTSSKPWENQEHAWSAQGSKARRKADFAAFFSRSPGTGSHKRLTQLMLLVALPPVLYKQLKVCHRECAQVLQSGQGKYSRRSRGDDVVFDGIEGWLVPMLQMTA
ncbi:uncharacterized protein LOC129742341 [Uranotaenia lowii]|uniref:uncharacterized protein LOC129742341 n=1 Tax=Uranotaenia lowii TaxID=190385 RepID=UPI002479319D|nr:uncharacterized protein LOC129742341 [Uranotaenia lowii]